MRIERRTLGRITVLDISGTVTLADGAVELRQAMEEMIKLGKTLVVLNLSGVPYIDSSGLMELVQGFSIVRSAGGRVWLSDPTKRLVDLLAITKLLTVFSIVSESDIPHLEGGEALVAECPMCRPPTIFGLPVGNVLRCPGCGGEFRFRTTSWAQGAGEGTFLCEQFVAPTYETERIELTVDGRDNVTIHGRFDLFVFELFERLWHVLVPPRRVVLSLRYADSSEPGLRAVLNLFRGSADGSQAAMVIPDLPAGAAADLTASALIYPTVEHAYESVSAAYSGRGVPVRIKRD